MKKDPDIERGLLIGSSPAASKVHANENESLPSKKRKGILHVLIVFVTFAVSAGAGYAFFGSQRANQLVTFQTQFDR